MKLKFIALAVLVPGIALAQPAPQNPQSLQSTSMPMDQPTTSMSPANPMSTANPSAAAPSASSIKDEDKSNSKTCIHVSNDPYMTNICN